MQSGTRAGRKRCSLTDSQSKYADSLAFPFLRRELMAGVESLTPAAKLPDLIHATSVPPMVTSMVGIEAAHRSFASAWYKDAPKTTRAFFGLQHPPVDATADDLRALRRLEISVMTLAYETENVYGGGFADPDAPLTVEGEDLIRAMGSAGIVLDLSHAGHQTARDAMRFCRNYDETPRVIVSHSGCHEVYGHKRNLPDDVLRDVAEQGGVIGVPLVTWMLDSLHNGFEPFILHLSHVAKLVGFDAICIASDAEYAPVTLPYTAADIAAFEQLRAKLDPRGNFNPRFPEMPELFAQPDRMEQVERILAYGGMRTSQIDNVLYGNLNRFVTEAGIVPA